MVATVFQSSPPGRAQGLLAVLVPALHAALESVTYVPVVTVAAADTNEARPARPGFLPMGAPFGPELPWSPRTYGLSKLVALESLGSGSLDPVLYIAQKRLAGKTEVVSIGTSMLLSQAAPVAPNCMLPVHDRSMDDPSCTVGRTLVDDTVHVTFLQLSPLVAPMAPMTCTTAYRRGVVPKVPYRDAWYAAMLVPVWAEPKFVFVEVHERPVSG
mmetsp:Transcript_9890/g.23076  ORF Transcript_9890/g.23076 Transcript_9890/m.23076 type:complete len:214 (+) Transcript_9890:450-1091(+)